MYIYVTYILFPNMTQLLRSGNRYLIRSDDMMETVYNEKGEMVKTKERRLFMLNDVLMCATVSSRYVHFNVSNILLSCSILALLSSCFLLILILIR